MGDHGSFEQLARVVHGVAAFGGTVEDVLRMSGHSRDVLITALTFIDPNDPDTDETAWHHALTVLSEALQRLR